jgi:hypothetical protein
MRSTHRSILLTPLFLILAAASLVGQAPQAQEPQAPRTITLKLESTARCDADVRITQDGRAVVSRVVLEQLGTKKLNVEVTDNAKLIVHVSGRTCRIGYAIDVPMYSGSNTLTLEIGDTQQTVVARDQ